MYFYIILFHDIQPFHAQLQFYLLWVSMMGYLFLELCYARFTTRDRCWHTQTPTTIGKNKTSSFSVTFSENEEGIFFPKISEKCLIFKKKISLSADVRGPHAGRPVIVILRVNFG